MKSSRFARRVLKLQALLLILATVGMAALGFTIAESVPKQLAPASSQTPQPPPIYLEEVLARAR